MKQYNQTSKQDSEKIDQAGKKVSILDQYKRLVSLVHTCVSSRYNKDIPRPSNRYTVMRDSSVVE